MLPGENYGTIAVSIAVSERMGASTVRRWAKQFRARGNVDRKSGSGRPKKYTGAVLEEIVEINNMYEGKAASRDVADVLKQKFGFGSKTSVGVFGRGVARSPLTRASQA